MTLVWILVYLVILALFLAILNMILAKLFPALGVDAGWQRIILAIIGLACLIWILYSVLGARAFP